MLEAVCLLCFLSTRAELFNCENPGCFLEVAWRKPKTPQAGTEEFPTVSHPSTCVLALASHPLPFYFFLPALLQAQKASYISLYRCEIHLLLTILVLCILKILIYQTVWASSLPSQACNSLLYYITGRFCVFTYRNIEISLKPVAINILFPDLGCFACNCKGKYRSEGFFYFFASLNEESTWFKA